jgi:hypothetical protein
MALIKTTTIDKIEIVGEYKHIQVREANIIQEDGVELTRSFNRYVLTPGQDISNQTLEIQSIASAIWTEDLIERYNQSELNNINP